MVRKPIENWLSSIFSLPIYEDFDQTKVERSISYDLSQSPIKIRYQDGGGSLVFEFPFVIAYRAPTGTPAIGWLSATLATKDKQIDGFGLTSTQGSELVIYETKTEMIISKTVHAKIVIDYNKVQELIKQVNLISNGVLKNG